MIGWCIFGGIVLLIAVLLFLSVTVRIDYENSDADIKVYYSFFTIFPIKEKKKKPDSSKKAEPNRKPQDKPKTAADRKTRKTDSSEPPKTSEQPKEPSNEPPDKTSDEPSEKPPKKSEEAEEPKKKSKVDFALIKQLIDSAGKPIRRFFRKLRVTELYIDCVVGGSGAAQVATNYGTYCGVIYGLVNWLGAVFTVKAKDIQIEADFDKEKTDLFMHMKIKMRVGTALFTVLWFGVRFLLGNTKKTKRKKAPKKAAKKGT